MIKQKTKSTWSVPSISHFLSREKACEFLVLNHTQTRSHDITAWNQTLDEAKSKSLCWLPDCATKCSIVKWMQKGFLGFFAIEVKVDC